jgi:SAM-dependent methyltransferase
MAERATHDPGAVEVGFARVDAQPDPGMMVAGLDAIARWPAVRRLRRWERQQLALRPGDRLLDVGCGTADVACALAADLSPGGEVLAVDASEAMLAAARHRIDRDPTVPVRLQRGDALDPPLAEGPFTAVRGERVLQWVPRPADAVAALVRVLSPGGRLTLIDTDWRTFAVDLPAGGVGASELTGAMVGLFGDGATAGGRLLNLCRDAGLGDLRCTAATHVATSWDPDGPPGADGFPPVLELVPLFVERGVLDADAAERGLAALIEAARENRFFATVSMIAVAGVKPEET